MGTTYAVGFGYGVMVKYSDLEKKIPADIQAALDEEYMGLGEMFEAIDAPLLVLEQAGNMWNGGDGGYVGIFIASTAKSDYDFVVSSKEHHLPNEEEMKALTDMLVRLSLTKEKLKWWAWSYQG